MVSVLWKAGLTFPTTSYMMAYEVMGEPPLREPSYQLIVAEVPEPLVWQEPAIGALGKLLVEQTTYWEAGV